MLKPVFTKRFEKDVKKVLKQGKVSQKLKILIEKLVSQKTLPPIYRDHKLIGNYSGRRE